MIYTEISLHLPSDMHVIKPNMRSRRRLTFLKRSGLFDGNIQGVTIKRAWSLNDLRDAYRLVHDVYAKSGFICSDPSRLRVRMFEMTPETATFVANVGDRVIGVVSIVGDSPGLGLPSDSSFQFELDELRARGMRLCEWTNQVVAEEYRNSAVVTELMRCAAAHIMNANYDEAIATISPSHRGFYELFGFREIGTQRSYSENVYDPVVAMSIDVQIYECAGGKDDTGRFFYRFMSEENPFHEKVGQWALEAKSCFLKKKLLQHLFITESGFITRCSAHQFKILQQCWGNRLFAMVTGDSLVAWIKNWMAALLSMFHLLDDDTGRVKWTN